MIRTEVIGDATLYLGLTRSQRSRLRKQGVPIPRKPMPSGYKQSPEHVAKRKRTAADHYNWQGDAISEKGGRKRALKLYRDVGSCTNCGAAKAERHHRDANTANNDPSNIAILCRRCHMEEDGRLEATRATASARQALAASLAAAEKLARTHCKRGHPLSGDNLFRTSAGARGCKACRKIHKAAYRARGAHVS